VGGRLFPGVHYHAQFEVAEQDDYLSVSLDSDDGVTHLVVEGRLATELPSSSVFHSLREASEFYEGGSLGYSATPVAGEFDGLELRTFHWQVQPLTVDRVESSFFDDDRLFPEGSVGFDCALVMREIVHEWHAQPSLCLEGAAV
jgi:hypothetical protein